MLKSIFAALAVSVVALTAGPAAAFDKKVALIVGNGAYANAPELANPVADAKAVAAAFERLGFTTVTGYDLDRLSLQETVRAFARASRDADLTAFYYAGHGIAFDGRNFMVPVDAKFSDATALDFEAVSVDFVTKQMRYADGVSLVFLDACRDNPLATTLSRSLGLSTRSALSRGLAQMDVAGAGKGLAIAFATSPGEVAFDGAGDNSPFTAALLNHIESPDTDITEVMSRVTGEVLRSTDERQRPWLNASLTGPVVLAPADEAAPAAVVSAPGKGTGLNTLEAQTHLFNLARESKQRADYEAYLTTFPAGLYAANARAAIAALGDSERAVRLETTVLASADPKRAEPLAFEAKAEPAASDEASETALGLNRSARREIQYRLNLEDADVGGADGLFGPRTRAGIKAWQETNGFAATGFLDAPQLKTLRGATEERYAALLARIEAEARARAERRRVAAAERAAAKRKASRTRSVKKTAKRSTKRSTKRSAPKRTKRRVVHREPQVISRRPVRRRQQVNPFAAAAAGAIVGGIVGGYIGR